MEQIIKNNLLEVKRKIAPYTPNIIAVTKYFDHTIIADAYKAGIRDFGENRVMDALAKIDALDEEIKKNSRFHLIGHLQKNKVKKAVGRFELIHSVDSLELAQVINEEAEKKQLIQKVLIQVNNAREPQKSGFLPEEIFEVFGQIIKLPNIKVMGLMNMAPLIDEQNWGRKRILELFKDVFNIKSELEKKYSYEMKELSMGMSNDYDLASSAGSTMIRLGRVLYKN